MEMIDFVRSVGRARSGLIHGSIPAIGLSLHPEPANRVPDDGTRHRRR